MPTFELDNGCVLRLLEESDAPRLYSLIDANRGHLSRWLPWAASQTLDSVRAFVLLTLRQVADNDGFQTAIAEPDGSIVGVIGFHHVSWADRSTSLGYWLAETAQGRGIMTRAASALTDHAFSIWLLNRVEISSAVENARSRAIPERLGFVCEGVLREAERVGERYLDSVVYSMLAREWPGS